MSEQATVHEESTRKAPKTTRDPAKKYGKFSHEKKGYHAKAGRVEGEAFRPVASSGSPVKNRPGDGQGGQYDPDPPPLTDDPTDEIPREIVEKAKEAQRAKAFKAS